MSLFAQLQSAATAAQATLAELTGAPAGRENVVGPDGALYFGVARPANAYEQAEAEARGLTSHGQMARSIVVLSITRDQFDAPPMAWAMQELTLRYPAPVRRCYIHAVNPDDPLSYVFTLHYNQASQG
jgi:hypothetical protein